MIDLILKIIKNNCKNISNITLYEKENILDILKYHIEGLKDININIKNNNIVSVDIYFIPKQTVNEYTKFTTYI